MKSALNVIFRWQKHCVKSVRIWSICPYSVWMRENVDQNNSEYEHFSRSENYFAVILAFTEQNMNFQNFSWACVPSKKSPQFAFFFKINLPMVPLMKEFVKVFCKSNFSFWINVVPKLGSPYIPLKDDICKVDLFMK